MASRQPPKPPTSGTGGKSASKESLKKQLEKQPTARKTSADKGGTSSRGGTASLPSSPHNPRPTSGPPTKKPAPSVTPRKDSVVKAKVGKPLQKDQAVADVVVVDLPEDLEALGAVGGEPAPEVKVPPFERLPETSTKKEKGRKGPETGEFGDRKGPEIVRPVALRPELSPRSKRVHESARNFLAVKRQESNDQKRMETFIMEMFPKLQNTLARVQDLNHRAAMFRVNPPQGGDDAVRKENDLLNFQIALAGKVFKDFDALLTETKSRVESFIKRAEKGTLAIDDKLRKVVNDICNYSRAMSDLESPEGVLGGDQEGDPGDRSGGDRGDAPKDRPDGKPSGDGSGGDQGGKPGDGPDGQSGDGSGGKSGDGSPQGNGYGGDQGDGSGGDRRDKSEDDNQGGKPEDAADDDMKHTDDLEEECLGDDDYDSLISPSASESEPEFEEDVHEHCPQNEGQAYETLAPVMVTVGEEVKSAIRNPERIEEVMKVITETAESSARELKSIYKSGPASKLIEVISEIDHENPQKALEKMVQKFVHALGYFGPNTAERGQFDGTDGLMDTVKARWEEVPKDTVSSETKSNANVSKDGKTGVSTDGVTTKVDL